MAVFFNQSGFQSVKFRCLVFINYFGCKIPYSRFGTLKILNHYHKNVCTGLNKVFECFIKTSLNILIHDVSSFLSKKCAYLSSDW